MLCTMAEQKVVALERPVAASGLPAELPAGAVLGWVERVDDDGIWVGTEDGASGPMLALSVAPLSRSELEAAVDDRRPAVLLFVVGTGQPVLLGLQQAVPAVEVDAGDTPLTADVDGKRVRIDGKDEIVLRCGKSSITMRRNGRIVIRGVQVESRAAGRNRIKGGAVLIN